MKAKWNEWKNSIKQMRVDKRWFDITCKIISFPFVLLYHILNFCLTFSKVILNVILPVEFCMPKCFQCIRIPVSRHTTNCQT